MTPSGGGKGRLTLRQRTFAKLVADGVDESKAMEEAGYAKAFIPRTLYHLRQNHKVLALIESYKTNSIKTGSIATKTERKEFWTEIMTDPSYPVGMRLKASELLGRAEKDFTDKKQDTDSKKIPPVVLLPNISPADWEKQWENVNKNV